MKVLITGGSRGIGRSCVELFTRKGDDVVFVYAQNDSAAKDCKENTGAVAVKGDISDFETAGNVFVKAESILGGIDVLINNAGISYIGLFTDMSLSEWRKITDINLSSAFYMSQHAARSMLKRHSGRIINIGSVWGRCGASCEVAYSAAKAGLRGLTMSLAKELGPSGINVNCVEPGVIDTDMNAHLDGKTLEELTLDTPLCRIGTPADVAKAVYFLASDDSSFITGQIIGVDGGFGL